MLKGFRELHRPGQHPRSGRRRHHRRRVRRDRRLARQGHHHADHRHDRRTRPISRLSRSAPIGIGNFINAVIAFLIKAAGLYFLHRRAVQPVREEARRRSAAARAAHPVRGLPQGDPRPAREACIERRGAAAFLRRADPSRRAPAPKPPARLRRPPLRAAARRPTSRSPRPCPDAAPSRPRRPRRRRRSSTGTVTYRQRIALTPEAVVQVELRDVSLPDADGARSSPSRSSRRPARCRSRSRSSTTRPLIAPGHTYAISARITDRGQLQFVTDTRCRS